MSKMLKHKIIAESCENELYLAVEVLRTDIIRFNRHGNQLFCP